MQIIKADGTAITGWFGERAVVTPVVGTHYRLSGSAIRHHLYSATALGNTALYVAVEKHGIVSQLPVIYTGPKQADMIIAIKDRTACSVQLSCP
jgi:hypothetical protein